MRIMEELDIDEMVDVPDTPDRLAGRRVIGRESMGRDWRDSSTVENFRSRASRDILFENHVNGLRAKDKPGTQNGHSRRPINHPPKSFSNHRYVVSSSEDSLASQNGRLFRKAAVDESSSHGVKYTSGVRSIDKGKSISVDKPSNNREGTDFFDLTKQNDYAGNSKLSRPNGAPKHDVADDKKKGLMSLSGSFSGSHLPDSFGMFREAFRGNEKIGESTPRRFGVATVRGETIVLSPDSQHESGELPSSNSLSSPRVTGRKCLVKNGCISPQNIAKAEQIKGSSKNTEQSRTVNGSSNFTTSPLDIISDVVAEENDSGRRNKGKATLTVSGASKQQNENPFFATSGSRGSDCGEANGSGSSRKHAIGSQGFGGWRTTHNHSSKQDNSVPNVVEHNSGRIRSVIRVARRESEMNHHTENDPSEGENDVATASSWFETGQSSGRHRAEKAVTKKLKSQVPTPSTSMSEDSDVLFVGPSGESVRPRSSRVQRPRSRSTLDSVIEVDELSPPVRHSAPQSIEYANDDDSDIRAMQVEADEILARELQEQLYQEMPMVGGGERDEHLAWALQHENGSNSSGARRISSHSGQPRSRSNQPRPSSRGGIRSRAPASSRMAQIRGRVPLHRRTVSNRTRNLHFPLDMDLDMRLDILEALEDAVGDFGDINMGNPIYQVQRDFNENDYEMLLGLDEQNHQHAGASTNVINSLPQSVVQTDNQEACAICLETPTVGETVRHLPCFHKFHKDCIDPWLSRKTSCPVCKLSVT